MSDNNKTIPVSPLDILKSALIQRLLLSVDEVSSEQMAAAILEAFEEHDIDVTWRPAEQAHGTLGGDA